MFHDRARIEVLAGRGGDGGLSFRREKHVPKGGPDGGDGGRGGDVVLVAAARLRDLSSLRARTRFKAGRGEPGRGTRKHGADGESIELHVPVGTAAYRPAGELIADLATRPACWSEMTSATPVRPRFFSEVRNARQNVSSSLSPTSRPRISRPPSSVTPVATTTAWETTCPRAASRTCR